MGNSFRKLCHCCSCNGGSHEMMTHVMPHHPSQDFVGHSFCYVRPDPTRLSSSKVHSLNNDSSTTSTSSSSSSSNKTSTTFRSISGASVGANVTSVPSAAALPSSSPLLPERSSSTFESSELFASLTLQPVPRGTTHCWSGPMESGFLSGPIAKFQRSLSHGSLKSKEKGLTLIKSFKRAISNKMLKISLASDHHKETSSDTERSTENFLVNTNPSSRGSLSVDDHGDDDQNDDEGDQFPMKIQNLQWAQGKAGEDRTHLVVSEEDGWIFVGIYDGFSGPDATDHLLSNLFNAIFEELKGLLWNDEKDENKEKSGKRLKKWKCELDHSERMEVSRNPSENFEHSDVLKALSNALSKTEEEYLQVADLKPVLHVMGSCVLVMLMNGEDVYLMNVGDSRAILAQKTKPDIVPPFNLIPVQLTMDHNADVEEEVERIRKEHPDDDEAIVNERVKGYLKVTRAFGAGFLKQPKWNDALYEIFRINYVGTSPYIISSPSLHHYKLNPDDKFLILSSDGLYQYFTNQQVVSEIEWFTASFPEGDPAQHLVEEVLIRAAKKAGLEFHELVEIPPGQRRMYHDDVSVIIISLEGRIWGSSVNGNIS
ncbi:phosphatase 2C (PP2C)-like protein [Corchorus capsularis]|uniref:Phosphatase 2C (PP2C)-like protein n=1 Tax=Corchorus capsularis TaxID=210143 RepID=A0A1R3H7D8_COCAP|nr:phosphatase 2C (PP2C)-like protein [Corchorus capsularis]